jgi:hypothetical protein
MAMPTSGDDRISTTHKRCWRHHSYRTSYMVSTCPAKTSQHETNPFGTELVPASQRDPSEWVRMCRLDARPIFGSRRRPSGQLTVDSPAKADPVSWDTELARMTVTKEARDGNETEEAGAAAGAIQYTE